MCEAGVNVKVIQDALGHKDISTTLNIYTDVTKELKRSEFEGLDIYFKNEQNNVVLMFPNRECQDFFYENRNGYINYIKFHIIYIITARLNAEN